jgi:transketolase
VAEEANLSGGLGAAVASRIAQLPKGSRPPVRLLGLTEFAPTGSNSFLLEYFGLTEKHIADAAREALNHG